MNARFGRLLAEFVGTFFLVLAGCGTAVLAGTFPEIGVGIIGVALGFGLALLVMAYAIGDISGCHINPAVSVGLWIGGRFPGRDVLPYIAVQVLGGIVAAAVLYMIAGGTPGFTLADGFAANGYAEHSPGGYSLLSALTIEVVMTTLFVFAIMGATHKRVPAAVAPVAIGLALTLVHLISIPVTNTSVNPARSTGVALFVGDWALSQLWLFWLAPIAGGVGGALLYRALGERSTETAEDERAVEVPPDAAARPV
ncbi:aquaporin Z [Lujinxingia sediminis]|uniref:Aquaporin Z n=1 Tax=Lujinxingia sediminis TaxID=2480984 RepID=A0ABY0CWU4_9DELT|nr:aquaporin Z [Lujinxingia sediminis]RVU48316.1 aquaporin Z [Lujinxingia sediminis]